MKGSATKLDLSFVPPPVKGSGEVGVFVTAGSAKTIAILNRHAAICMRTSRMGSTMNAKHNPS